MADFYLMGNTSHVQMFGCVIKTGEKTVVIDGGTIYDSKQMAEFLRKNCNSHVDAWFFTHPHHDHIGCFVDIRNNGPQITIDKVYHHFPNLDDTVYTKLARGEHEAKLWEDVNKWQDFFSVSKVYAGDVFEFDDVKIKVLRVFNPDIIDINNSSTVYRIEGKKHSILILGDLCDEACFELMKQCPFELLHTDYTQMAHHGQNGDTKEFYKYIKPKRCIWASPEWLWNNDIGKGFDTGPYKTVRTREWMEELGVNEHFVEKDGIQKIEF